MDARRRALMVGGLLSTLALLGFQPCRAAWPHSPIENVPVCTAAGDQQIFGAVSDAAGGVIFAWADYRGGSNGDIYAQRISAAGTALWAANGVPVCTASGDQTVPAVVADGAGGAIVVWKDYRAGNYDIYAQRISAAGAVQWTAHGVALCTASGMQTGPEIVSDGAGGAIVSWEDLRVGNHPYAQRVSAAGVVQWTANGVPLCSAGSFPQAAGIVADGEGGAIVTWLDDRSGTTDIYAQRLSAAGAARWTANGVPVCVAVGSQMEVSLISDGVGGAVIAWSDDRGVTFDIYVQRLSSTGAAQWTTDGVAVCTAGGEQNGPALVPDGAGGSILVWADRRFGDYDVYAQRVVDGVVQWAANGMVLSAASGNQLGPHLVQDGEGGAIVAWAAEGDIYAQRVSNAGVIQWAGNGEVLCSAPGYQSPLAIASDGGGGAIVAWYDYRNGSNYDIYAQRIEHFGYLGSPEPEIVSARDVAGDEGGRVKLSWNASYLDLQSDPNLDYYDILRSVPSSLAQRALANGARLVSTLEDLAKSDTPAYFVTKGDKTYYWEYLAAVTAVHYLSGYSYLAATTCDSAAAGNPLTAFMVVARESGRTMFWLSAPFTGYSVDNLAPGMPVFLASRHAGDATRVRWQPNTEADLFGYRLYRGRGSGFVPGPANLVTAQADTGFVDSGAPPFSWYKLTAVDVHGNESLVATLSPQDITGVGDGGAPAVTRLIGAAPNPFNPMTTIAFTLAQPGRVVLAVYDAAGRSVRTLVDEARPVGRQEARWDGRTDGGRSVASGIYFCRLEAGSVRETKRLTLVR